MSATTDIGTSKTLEFPNPIARRLAEVAIERERERQEMRSKLDDMARLGSRERVVHHLELGDETYVVEVVRGEESTWSVIRGGRLDYRGFYTLDEALLLAVELRNGGGPNDKGHVYAARMLGAGAKPAAEAAR